MNFNKKQYSFEEVYSKLMRYCAYQERSTYEAKNKAFELGLRKNELQKLIDLLQEENFIADERFAKAYVSGKVNVKKWGRYKISEGLFAKGITGETAEEALREIDEMVYFKNLSYWVDYKLEREVYTKAELPKLYRFLQSKGYESEFIAKELKGRKLM
ncbi:MAG: RecX family transcriptional regulator [Bacteroidetes bacterium]|nr:MAG: RecX family transcriptional regulator [Bacteroidota bacterium]MBL1143948.1 RecX family transcriptional regulator [Bacteroidota bacterium]MCB0802387.1 RecX family transcriptional regulator [Flavobacteriales bacterium]NOG56749.1 RecX family transcriptional regulator [Bacteroidota bacterium]